MGVQDLGLDESTPPNTARIIDYWLGGAHHGPADVKAAHALDAIYGRWPEVFWELRRFIGRGAQRIHAEGIDQLLVLGSGVPTQGNVHEAVPEAKVFYTDIDPINIEIGQRILAGSPRAGYGYCDAFDLSTLDRTAMERVLGPVRRLGIVMVGVAAFIPDDKLRATYKDLYAWAPAGSRFLFDFDGTEEEKYPEAAQMLGDGFFMRKPEAFAPLLGDWRLTEDGIQPVGAWRSPGARVPPFMYGGLAYKP